MALLPLAAVVGVFGPATAREAARAGSIAVEAEYPSRLRTAMADRIGVSVSNPGEDPVAGIHVAIARDYVDAFDDLGFTPDPDRPYVFTIDALQPGETRRVEMEVHAAQYGRHEGSIAVRHSAGAAELPLRTLIFP